MAFLFITLVATVLAASALATTTSHSTSTSTSSSAYNRPTTFQVRAVNSNTIYDGKLLQGGDGSLNNITFQPRGPSYETKFWLPGINKWLRLASDQGQTLFGGYHCGVAIACSDTDTNVAFLTFGGDVETVYYYTRAFCSVVPKPNAKYHLACSVKATDGKMWYRKALVALDDGHVILNPEGALVPTGYAPVEMELVPVSDS
ncbi:MAG: hypothetical protein GOMPHAMPRED_000916 [Gomphillus americanus]|uniref:Uncharacterized protein n=1 Tax=Gomphillus americanus TaxID=1940652 RepID=A0A8H3F0Q2_9LECA|nr:MAG: hypothetical protein GOMPHAMPRED_000916 [Gomphillus americanus]